MGFIEKTRQFLRGTPQQPQRASPSFPRRQPPRREKKYTRSEFRGLLKGAWKGSRISQQERTGLEKNLFPYQKYGPQISEKDVKSALQKLRRDEFWTKTSAEKEKISRQRKALEEATGFKGKY